MKTVADLKRAIKVGTKLSSTYHLKFAGRDTSTGEPIYQDDYKGIREVSVVQATQFALKTLNTKTGLYVDSWMPWPRREAVAFNADGSFTIREQNERTGEWVNVITYSFQPETASQVEFHPDNRDHEFDNVTSWNQ